MQRKISDIGFYFLVVAAIYLFAITAYRASTLSMTHDESGTYMFFIQENVMDYFINKDLWRSANNHLLNTVAMQWCVKAFGQSDLTVRLPNVLACLVYLLSLLGIIRTCFKRWEVQLLAFCLLALNPFVNDFFSLARGYGMSVGFQLMALYQFILFFKKKASIHLVLAYLALGLASLSLFTNLLFIPAYTAALWLVYLLDKESYAELKLEIFTTPIIAAVAIGILVYVPITALSHLDEFKWGAKSLFKTNVNLANDSLYGKKYLGRDTKDILSVILAATVLIGALTSVFWKELKQVYENHKSYLFVSLAFLFLIIGMMSAYVILEGKYPDGRKSTMLIPLMGLIITYFFDSISWRHFRYVVLIVVFMLVYHFFSAFKISQVKEWWYDRSTKEFVSVIHKDAEGRDVVIGTHWMFHPTATYYLRTKGYDHMKMQSYSKKLHTDRVYDYFISTGSDWKYLEKNYEKIMTDRHGMLVLKKK